MACSRNIRSVSVCKSSEMGIGPSLSSPFEALNVRGSVIILPLLWGISDDSKPVDSSHAFGETTVALEVATSINILVSGNQALIQNIPSNFRWLLTTRITAALPRLPLSPLKPSPAPGASPPTPSVNQPTNNPKPDLLIRI